MTQWTLSPRTGIFVLLLQLAIAQACRGHVLWLKTIDHQDQPHAFLYFGENIADEAYHLPDRLAQTDIWLRRDGHRTRLATQRLESEERIGLISPLAVQGPYVLEAAQQYGVYGKSLLLYYAKHVHADSPQQMNSLDASNELKLDIVPRLEEGALELMVYWFGKPLPSVELRVTMGDQETLKEKSDEEGRVALKWNGRDPVTVLANHFDKEPQGDLDGQPYQGALHYASLILSPCEPTGNSTHADSCSPLGRIPPLPEAVSSFGAAVAGDWLFVYSGHTGNEHEHSAANLSRHFRRVRLDGTDDWEELPMQTPLQGLALVAHEDKVYRVGGMNARNATLDEEEELHSVDDFAEFDPATRQWRLLPPLPTPRSSHNAVVIGSRLYVVGGWTLSGQSPGHWQNTALKYDFDNPQAGWQRLPDPPFTRRALAVSHWRGHLVAIGGIDENGDSSTSTNLFDLQTGKWSIGPELPEDGMGGFGASACNSDGQLYVSGVSGVVYRLNETGSAWEEAGRLKKGRFFHQLLPTGDGRLVAVGGASRDGHLSDIEWVEVSP